MRRLLSRSGKASFFGAHSMDSDGITRNVSSPRKNDVQVVERRRLFLDRRQTQSYLRQAIGNRLRDSVLSVIAR